jgi:hypothetical protein
MTSLARNGGGYLTLHHNDDGIAYAGPHAEEQVFIVGKGMPEERIFRQDQLAEASAYAREAARPLIPAAAGNLPGAAARALYDEELVDA